MAADPQRIQRLRAVLSAGPPLQLAILFGSSARGTRHVHSDVDLAILPADAALSLADESDLQLALERACGGTVDLVRLDRAPLVLRWRIASEGVPVVGDHVTWARFAAATASEHADFGRRRIDDLEAFRADTDRQDALALSPFVAMKEALDIAMHICADEGWGIPASYGESFEILARHGVIDAALAGDLARMTALRTESRTATRRSTSTGFTPRFRPASRPSTATVRPLRCTPIRQATSDESTLSGR